MGAIADGTATGALQEVGKTSPVQQKNDLITSRQLGGHRLIQQVGPWYRTTFCHLRFGTHVY
jgi:hypothetical protein